jgi:hypothetical protein
MADAASPSPEPPPPLLRFRSSSAHSTRSVARYGLRAPSTSCRSRAHPKIRPASPSARRPRTTRYSSPCLARVPEGPRRSLSKLRPLQGMATVPLVCRRVATTLEHIRASQGLCPFGALRWLRLRTSRPGLRRDGSGLPHPIRSVSRDSHPPDGLLRNHPCQLVSSDWRPWGSSLQSLLAKSRNASRRPLPS